MNISANCAFMSITCKNIYHCKFILRIISLLLYFLTHLEELQGSVSDGVQVGWGLVSPFVTVEGSHDGSVHHQPLVGVDTDTEQARVGVDLKNLVTGSQVVEDTCPAGSKQETIFIYSI